MIMSTLSVPPAIQPASTEPLLYPLLPSAVARDTERGDRGKGLVLRKLSPLEITENMGIGQWWSNKRPHQLRGETSHSTMERRAVGLGSGEEMLRVSP